MLPIPNNAKQWRDAEGSNERAEVMSKTFGLAGSM